ncbi:MAG: VOC family protein [Chloroflexi bacterium]|nr:MAG: VOC family protein [Chloroflexota bacterium]
MLPEPRINCRAVYGLGCERGPYLPFAGTRGHNVPLEPPAYLELLTIENREAAASTETGRRVLAQEAAGGGLFSWCVLVDDLEASPSRSSTTRPHKAMAPCGAGAA